jgi:hypothetical protein
MAYPDPIPALNARDAKEFKKRLEKFKLTSSQKKFYKETRAKLKKHK